MDVENVNLTILCSQLAVLGEYLFSEVCYYALIMCGIRRHHFQLEELS